MKLLSLNQDETAKVFKIKARAKGEGGEGFRNTDIEGKEHFYVSIKVKKLKEKDNKGIKKLDKIKLKIKKNRKYVKVVITDNESEVIDYDDQLPPEDTSRIPPGTPPDPDDINEDDTDDINEDDIEKIDDDIIKIQMIRRMMIYLMMILMMTTTMMMTMK